MLLDESLPIGECVLSETASRSISLEPLDAVIAGHDISLRHEKLFLCSAASLWERPLRNGSVLSSAVSLRAEDARACMECFSAARRRVCPDPAASAVETSPWMIARIPAANIRDAVSVSITYANVDCVSRPLAAFLAAQLHSALSGTVVAAGVNVRLLPASLEFEVLKCVPPHPIVRITADTRIVVMESPGLSAPASDAASGALGSPAASPVPAMRASTPQGPATGLVPRGGMTSRPPAQLTPIATEPFAPVDGSDAAAAGSPGVVAGEAAAAAPAMLAASATAALRDPAPNFLPSSFWLAGARTITQARLQDSTKAAPGAAAMEGSSPSGVVNGVVSAVEGSSPSGVANGAVSAVEGSLPAATHDSLFSDSDMVAGLDEPLSLLLESLLLPHTRPDLLSAVRLQPAAGVLLHGPPGTGKTALIRAAASAAARCLPGTPVKVFAVDGASLLSGVPGQTEAALRRIFAEAAAHAGQHDDADDGTSARRGAAAAIDAGGNDEAYSAVSLIDFSRKDGAGSTDGRSAFNTYNPPAAAGVAAHESSHGAAHGLSIVFLDEMDALCPARFKEGARVGASGSSNPILLRTVAQLLTLMDGAAAKLRAAASAAAGSPVGRVVVVGATNRPDAIDPALRRPGRFDREVRIPIPDAAARLAILRLQTARLPLSREAQEALPQIASDAVGFVGADLQALVREAARRAASRVAAAAAEAALLADGLFLHRPGPGSDSTPAGTDALARESVPPISLADLTVARAGIMPSALRGVATRVEPARWEDVGGMADVIARLRSAVEGPLTHAALYARMGVAPPRGVLLHGPPGNSKTTLVRALASAVRAAFVALSAAEVYSPYVGEAERILRAAFARAREAAPCILFLDEIDALVGSRGIGAGAGGGNGECNMIL